MCRPFDGNEIDVLPQPHQQINAIESQVVYARAKLT